MQSVDRVPRATDVEGDVCGAPLEEGSIDVVLEDERRGTGGGHGTAGRAVHRTGGGVCVVFSAKVGQRGGEGESETGLVMEGERGEGRCTSWVVHGECPGDGSTYSAGQANTRPRLSPRPARASLLSLTYSDTTPRLARPTMSFPQPHPRFSVLSSSSLASLDHLSPAASSTRFSLPSAPSINTALAAPKPGIRPNIYERNLNKTRTAEVSASAFAFLFSEVVQYTQKRVSGIADLERRYVRSCLVSAVDPDRACRLNTLGYRVGVRVLELMIWRNESSSKTPKREIRFLPALMSIHTHVWRAVFGKPADAIEKSVENPDECE